MCALFFLLYAGVLSTPQISHGPGVPAGKVSGMGHSAPNWVAALSQDSHFHKTLENQFVIVWQVRVKPGDSTLLDRHETDFLEIVIESGTVSMADERGRITPLRLAPGARLIRGGFAARLKNTDKSAPLHAVFVEFRSPLGSQACGPEAEILCPAGGDIGGALLHHEIGIVKTGHFCARRFLMNVTVHAPVLLIAIRPARVIASDSPAASGLLKAGQATWLPTGEQSVQAPSPSASIDLVGVEFGEPRN